MREEPDKQGLYQCPHDKAVRCIMDEGCRGCEVREEHRSGEEKSRGNGGGKSMNTVENPSRMRKVLTAIIGVAAASIIFMWFPVAVVMVMAWDQFKEHTSIILRVSYLGSVLTLTAIYLTMKKQPKPSGR